MKTKTFLIKEGKIKVLQEEDTSNLTGFAGSEQAPDVASGVKKVGSALTNITQGVMNDIATGMGGFLNLMSPEKFKKILDDGNTRKQQLDQQWGTIKDSLGINEPIEEFLKFASPAGFIAKKMSDKLIDTKYYKEEGVWRDFTNMGTELFKKSKSLENAVLKTFGFKLTEKEKQELEDEFDKQKKSTQDSRFKDYIEFLQKLSIEEKQKLADWQSKNPKESEELIKKISDNPKLVIEALKKIVK